MLISVRINFLKETIEIVNYLMQKMSMSRKICEQRRWVFFFVVVVQIWLNHPLTF